MQGMVVVRPDGPPAGLLRRRGRDDHLAYARPTLASREMLKGEFFTLTPVRAAGHLVMCSANNFLVVYLGLELMSLSLYALVALRRDHAVATEAAMKYFVLGALASGFLLYGLSMMYGATGTLEIPKVFRHRTGRINKEVLVFGLVFVVAGLAFKLGAAPFHMWVPDVYQGAPTAVTLLIGGAPKLAAFAITIRLLVEGHAGPGGRLAADAHRAGGGLAGHRQPGRHRADQPQAHAGLLHHRADGLHAAGPVGRRGHGNTQRPATPTARPCSTWWPTCSPRWAPSA
jgi:NADH-quinone oxidoreductase subunit N